MRWCSHSPSPVVVAEDLNALRYTQHMNDPDSVPFGDLLRRHRMLAGLTQEELAERAGLSVRGISDMERGTRHVPRRGTLRMLLDALPLEEPDRLMLEQAGRRRYRRDVEGEHPDHGIEDDPDTRQRLLRPSRLRLVGREAELGLLHAMIAGDEASLITLTGPAGVGKSALAMRVGSDLTAEFRDGVSLVDLSAIRDPELVAQTIAESLKLPEAGGRSPEDIIVEALHGSSRLLVLDNFEQVIEAASMLSILVDACPSLRILVTSRTVLNLSIERVFDLGPLSVPSVEEYNDLESLKQCHAVALFCARAAAANARFQLTPDNAQAVVEISRKLDGLPLAIELAAARTRLLPAQDIAQQLSRPLDLLTRGARDSPVRHHALRSAIGWSFDLLSESERHLFSRLSVFAGGATLDAVEVVCRSDGDIGVETLDGLSSLLDNSLIRRDQTARSASPRFRMLDTIREYARERLEESRQELEVRGRHVQWVVGLVSEAEKHLVGPDQIAWISRLDAEIDNIRAALRWAIDRTDAIPALLIASSLWRFWYARGHLSEGRRWLQEALMTASVSLDRPPAKADPMIVKTVVWAAALATDQGDYEEGRRLAEWAERAAEAADESSNKALALNVRGNVARYRGSMSEARALYEQALSDFRERDDDWGTCLSLNNLGAVWRELGSDDEAVSAYEASLLRARRMGDLWSIAIILANLGESLQDRGEANRALALFEESLRLKRTLDDMWGMADSMTAIAGLECLRGDLTRSAKLYRDSLALYMQVSDRWRIAVCLESLAAIGVKNGKAERAARLLGAASLVRDTIGHPLAPSERRNYEDIVNEVQNALGGEPFAIEWDRGKIMKLEDVANEVMELV